MSNCNDSSGESNSSSTKNVKSVSAGGESVTLDSNANKADERDERNQCPANHYNRRVRPFSGTIIGGHP